MRWIYLYIEKYIAIFSNSIAEPLVNFLPIKHIKCFPIPLFRHIVKFYFVQLMIIDFHNIYLGAILRILTNALSSFKSPRKQILKTLPSIINQIQLFILAKSYVWKTPIVLILQSIYRNPKLIELRASLQNPIRKGIFL